MNDTARHTIPRRLDDPERWLFWTVDEAAALMGPALLGLAANQFVPGLVAGVGGWLALRRVKRGGGANIARYALYWFLPDFVLRLRGTRKSFYVEISRARDRAELVTDDAADLRAQLQAVTGERIAALEGIGEMKREAQDKAVEAARPDGRQRGSEAGPDPGKERERPAAPPKEREMPAPARGRGADRDLGL